MNLNGGAKKGTKRSHEGTNLPIEDQPIISGHDAVHGRQDISPFPEGDW